MLKPWCERAALRDLRLAEELWPDLAGKVDPQKTLWCWAWNRFPGLVNSELQGIDETNPLTVTLHDGSSFTGYPDARQSQQGKLILLGNSSESPRRMVELGPFSIDDVASVTRSS
jgi:hypothetical protein